MCWHIIMVTLLIGLVSCQKETDRLQRLLSDAEGLISDRPDEALSLLNDISLGDCNTKTDSAWYALLLTQAQDKNAIPQVDDWLIKMAVCYYGSSSDDLRRALSYFYWGRVCKEAKSYGKAIQCFLTGLPYAQKCNNLPLQGQMQLNAAHLYYLQKMHLQADRAYQEGGKVGIAINDSSMLIESLLQRGKIQMHLEGIYSGMADSLISNALHLSTAYSKNSELTERAYAALTELYIRRGDKAEALSCALTTMSMQKEKERMAEACWLLGEAYYLNNRLDLAEAYAQDALLLSESHAVRSNAYNRLKEIAEQQGNLQLALDYSRRQISCKDSLWGEHVQSGVIDGELEEMKWNDLPLSLSASDLSKRFMWVLVAWAFLSFGILFHEKMIRPRRVNKLIVDSCTGEVQLEGFLDFSNDSERKRAEILRMQFQQSLKDSDVYQKIDAIIQEYRLHGKSFQKLDKEDWHAAMAVFDACWPGFMEKLQNDYLLNDKELCLCCFLLSDIPVKDFCCLFQCTRDTIYKQSNRLLIRKINGNKGKNLKDVLLYMAWRHTQGSEKKR